MLVLYLYATVCLLVGVSESGRSGMEAEISHDPSLSVLQYSVFLLVVIVDSAGNCLSQPRGEPPRSCSVPLKCDYKKKKNRTLSTEHFHSVLLVPVCSCSLPFCTRAHSPYLHTNLSGSIGAYRPFGIFSGFPLLCQCSSAVSRTKLTRSKKCSGYTHSLHFKEAFLLLSIQSDSWSMTWWTPMYLFCSLYILTYCIRLVFDL